MLMTDTHVCLSMERHIQSMDVVLQRAGKLIPRRRTPISPKLGITDLRPLNHFFFGKHFTTTSPLRRYLGHDTDN
jgi:hypothetical protein